MNKRKDTTANKVYRNYRINNGYKHDFSCYTKTLDQIIDQMEYCTMKHSKVLCVRLDIRNPQDNPGAIQRKDMTRIQETARRTLERKYKDAPNRLDYHAVWTTEKDNEKPHYHMQISVNGNTIHNGHAIMQAMQRAVNTHLKSEHNGLVEFSKSNGKYGNMLDRNSAKFPEQIKDAVYTASYLAKTNSKEGRPKGARISSATRLPCGWQDCDEYKKLRERIDSSRIEIEEHKQTRDVVQEEFYTCQYPPADGFLNDDEDFVQGPITVSSIQNEY